jgi:prepilin-type N-terminal cleavage/methylation domain-containing protein
MWFFTGSAMNGEGTPRNSGFSLLELLLVLGILVTFAGLAIPRYSDAVFRHQADLAARRVMTDLRQAQSYAKTASSACTVSFYANTEQYQLTNVPSFDGQAGDYMVDLSVDPYNAKLTSADFGGTTQVVFDGWGMPNSGGTVVVAVGSEQRTIVVDGETGEVTIP